MDLPQRKNIRKTGYKYDEDGIYFITICTQNREHFFGEIKNNEIYLNDLGRYTRDCRRNIPKHFPFVEIGEFICMPDHIHGILTINHKTNRRDGLSSVRPEYPNDDVILNRTKNISSLHGAISGSLGSIVRGFKIDVIKFARTNNIPFERQSRYYDHIIVDDKELFLIEKYIKDNPKNNIEREFEW